MWEHYKKTARFMQSFIALACVVLYFLTDRQPLAVLAFFLAMQVAAVLGAAYAANLRYRMERARQRDELPLLRGR